MLKRKLFFCLSDQCNAEKKKKKIDGFGLNSLRIHTLLICHLMSEIQKLESLVRSEANDVWEHLWLCQGDQIVALKHGIV